MIYHPSPTLKEVTIPAGQYLEALRLLGLPIPEIQNPTELLVAEVRLQWMEKRDERGR